MKKFIFENLSGNVKTIIYDLEMYKDWYGGCNTICEVQALIERFRSKRKENWSKTDIEMAIHILRENNFFLKDQL